MENFHTKKCNQKQKLFKVYIESDLTKIENVQFLKYMKMKLLKFLKFNNI